MEQKGIGRPVVVIAGAAGLVGRALMAELQSWYKVIGLTRQPVKENKKYNLD